MSREVLIVLLIAALIILFHLGIIYSLRSGFYRTLGKAITGLQDPPWRKEERSLQDLRTRLRALEGEDNDESENTV
ncbi:MAG: hypothetical protein PVF49_05600 [Anaerolineales bacterium]|jgi:hypothetical protein